MIWSRSARAERAREGQVGRGDSRVPRISRADGVSGSVSVPMVGEICAVSKPSVSSTTRRTGAEIGLASSARPRPNQRLLRLGRRLGRSACSSGSSRSVVWPNSSETMSTPAAADRS